MLVILAGGCFPPVAPADTATTGGEVTTTGTTTTGEPPATTQEPTTTTGTTTATVTTELPTTGEPQPPQPVQNCQLLPAPELQAAACEGDNECRIREALILECQGPHSYHRLIAAPGDDAVLYVETRPEPTFAVQHEAFLLTPQSSGLADLWVTDGGISGSIAHLLPRADGEIELWVQDGQSSPVLHYLPHAEVDFKGYSVPHAVRDDMALFIGTETRPDDVPMARFTRKDAEGIHALFDLPGGRVEQPLIAAEAWTIWLHDVAGVLKMSWVDYDAMFGGMTLFVRDLEADPLDPGAPLALLDEGLTLRTRDVALSPFGAGDHAVVLTDRDLGEVPRFVANAPWARDEALGGVVVACPAPTCPEGCAAAPPCVEARAEAIALALQNGPTSVRGWHLECPHDVTLSWEEDHYFDPLCLCDKCRCDGVEEAFAEGTCELVASELAPDPDVPDALERSELWRRPLGVQREDLSVAAVARDATLWVMTRSSLPSEQIVLWAIDTE